MFVSPYVGHERQLEELLNELMAARDADTSNVPVGVTIVRLLLALNRSAAIMEFPCLLHVSATANCIP